MSTIILFGAGKSATVLIDYLLAETPKNNWKLIIADADENLVLLKTNHSPVARAVKIDITNSAEREYLVQQADVVISLMPPALHFLIAQDCVQFKKHLLTASYVDENTRSLQSAIENNRLIFLYEMGLDPGIDHMSAMKIMDDIKMNGGSVTSFRSHCGGLVAPENDDNPWRYKISWNPRNVVMAGKAGAVYKMDNHLVTEKQEELFMQDRRVHIPGLGELSYYPNRDSVSYIDIYQIKEAQTFIRTTLRYKDFMSGWKNILELKLTDETSLYETNGMSLQDFFKKHFDRHGIDPSFSGLKALTGEGRKLFLMQMQFLGLEDHETMVNRGTCSALDVLQFALEKKLALQPHEKDMIVMLHEIKYTIRGEDHFINSSLVVKGEDSLRTAMAKTVGLPLGIAAKLILNGKIKTAGLHIPIHKEIYEPVLAALEFEGICFRGESLRESDSPRKPRNPIL